MQEAYYQKDKIFSSNGDEIIVEPNKFGGWVDTLHQNNQVIISGWAADVIQGNLLDAVVIFIDDESVSVGNTNIARPDVSEKFDQDQILWSGYRFVLPIKILNDAKEVRVFAISNRIASELQYSPPAQEQLPQFQNSEGKL
jgi:hypothetical protein